MSNTNYKEDLEQTTVASSINKTRFLISTMRISLKEIEHLSSARRKAVSSLFAFASVATFNSLVLHDNIGHTDKSSTEQNQIDQSKTYALNNNEIDVQLSRISMNIEYIKNFRATNYPNLPIESKIVAIETAVADLNRSIKK